jgi:alpha-tubulin suppressor-like RCC1 family protein
MAVNHCYTLAVNDFGDLFSWGSNKEGRLGHKQDLKTGDVLDNPRKYDLFTNKYLKVVEVSCGTSHIAVIATKKSEAKEESGELYTWGLPLYGRLGYIDHDDDQNNQFDNDLLVYKTNPKVVSLPDKVVRISCGTDFTACITEKGHLYTWGTNKSGYLGVENITYDGDQAIVTTPTLVKTLVNKFIIQVVCGSKHMMCLTSERTVFSWGSGDNGILGHGNSYGLNKPELIKELKNDEIIFIAAGDFASAAINIKGHLFLWGKGKYGILGMGSEENNFIPKRVVDNSIDQEKIFFVSLGFYHTLCCSGI